MKSSKQKPKVQRNNIQNKKKIKVRQKVQRFVLKFRKYMLYFGKYR